MRDPKSSVKTGTLPRPTVKRTLSGRLIAKVEKVGWTWPSVGHGKHHEPDHPSRKHDVPRPERAYVQVAQPVPGQPRRRDRRTAERLARKEA
ncbi:MAG: hypothetical protein ACXVYY_01225 [Oryzihumus sp.]